ncbi:MAG: hypothetical protein FJX72_18775, partial [Armatimonadetes bacterium]|nr:hypothetical protein [Armatimonadota bacterium]
LLAPSIAGGLIAGGMCAAGGRGPVSVGVVALAVGSAWSAYQIGPVWTLVSEFRPAAPMREADAGGCPDNLRKLHTAARLYADSWDDVLPPSEVWMDRISEYVGDEGAMRCPAVAGDRYGYAMYDALGARVAGEVASPEREPLFYDSTAATRNGHDPFSSLPKPGRHDGSNNVVYLDGHTGGI